MIAAKATTPYAAQNFLNALRALISHCMVVGWCVDDPTQGVKRIPSRAPGTALGQRVTSPPRDDPRSTVDALQMALYGSQRAVLRQIRLGFQGVGPAAYSSCGR